MLVVAAAGVVVVGVNGVRGGVSAGSGGDGGVCTVDVYLFDFLIAVAKPTN